MYFLAHCISCWIITSRFSDVFFIDATTRATIQASLQNIALAKGIGKSDTDTLNWLGALRTEWLLFINNADDTSMDLWDYFPVCSHGNILVTTRNRDVIQHALESNYHVSKMDPKDAVNLLIKTAVQVSAMAVNAENEQLASILVKVGDYVVS